MNIPQPPKTSQEQLARCREADDYRPVLFDWYKYVGVICNLYASVRMDSPALRPMCALHYAVLVGLLNRCARLMLANVALSHEGRFGETTAIVDRCIFESAVKLTWLCVKGDEESFMRLIADGLKTELEFKTTIQRNISDRGGKPLRIEERMLASITRGVSESGLDQEEITSAKRLPDLAAMIELITRDRLLYVVGQKMGSHHVHGTWPSLRMHYLQDCGGVLGPRDHDCQTHVNQYVFVPEAVLGAMHAFVSFVVPDTKDAKVLLQQLELVRKQIRQIYLYAVGDDFEQVEDI